METQLVTPQDFAIGVIAGSAAMYASAVLMSRLDMALWIRVALGVTLLCCVPVLIVLAPESVDWRWIATFGYCLGFGINQLAAPWRVRTGQAA